MEKVIHKGVKFEDLCKVEVSGYFFGRLQALLGVLVEKAGIENYEKALAYIKENKVEEAPEDILELTIAVETLLILIKDIEQSFQKAGLIKDQTFEAPNDEEKSNED